MNEETSVASHKCAEEEQDEEEGEEEGKKSVADQAHGTCDDAEDGREGEEEERKKPAIDREQAASEATPPAAPRHVRLQSQMAKDPLDLGVPMPVLVERWVPVGVPMEEATAQTAVSDGEAAQEEVLSEREEGATAAHAAVASASARPCASSLNEVLEDDPVVRKARAQAAYDIVSMDDESSKQQHLSERGGNARRGRRLSAVRRRSSRSVAEEYKTEGEDIDLMEPGSYAIGGPGLAVPDPPSVASAEDTSYRFDIEQGHDGETGFRNSCSLGCSTTTTRISMSSHHSCSEVSNDYLVEATLVLEDQQDDTSAHGSVRDSSVMAEAKPLQRRLFTPCMVFLGCCFLASVVIVGLMVGLAFLFQLRGNDDELLLGGATTEPNSQSEPPTITATPSLSPFAFFEALDTLVPTSEVSPLRPPVLERVHERGVLRCGVGAEMMNVLEHMSSLQQHNMMPNFASSIASNLSSNYCKAIAAAILGSNHSSFELITLPQKQKPAALSNDLADLLISRHIVSMEVDVFSDAANEGLAFATPFLYSGLRFLGLPFYVDCAEDGMKTFGECSGITICISDSSPFLKELTLQIPQDGVIVSNNPFQLSELFINGTCNLIASPGAPATQAMILAMGYKGDLSLGKKEFTSGMWALTALDSDPEWVDFLNALTMGLLAAEEANISKDEAELIGQTSLFGDAYKDMFINAIKVSGNMGDIYDLPIPRKGRNLPNNGSFGLLMSPPLGDVQDPLHNHHRTIARNGTLEAILERRVLQCGIRGGRPGFAQYDNNINQWKGLDVDFCKALAASMFNGKTTVDFHDVSLSNGFVEMQHGHIDVYAGALWNLQNDVRERESGHGFAFSQPYFYGPVNDARFDENLCLATRQDDPQWSAFVYWTAQSLVYAEENGIVQGTSNQMPLVYVFGQSLQRMFRDGIHAVGCYDEAYERNLATILPRGGRNMLNSLNDDLPLRYIPPGLPI